MLSELRKLPSLTFNYLFSRPFYASFDVTNNCNLRCEGCDFPLLLDQGKLDGEVPFGNLEARIDKLGEAFGSLVVVIAGFEPTMRKDLAGIISKASERNIVGIVTNGTLIDGNNEKAREYWAAGISFISISMPRIDDVKFRELTRVQRYGVETIKAAIETCVATAPLFGKVVITATIDNATIPSEMEETVSYGNQVGALVSFQPYSASKPSSVDSCYDTSTDARAITIQTLENVFGGSLAESILLLKRKYGNVVGRKVALGNFDTFVKEGSIPFKPRSLKIYTNGDLSLYPEGRVFSNLDNRPPQQIWKDYRAHVEALREQGPFRANNCYRCVNLTTPSTPIGDIVGGTLRAVEKFF